MHPICSSFNHPFAFRLEVGEVRLGSSASPDFIDSFLTLATLTARADGEMIPSDMIDFVVYSEYLKVQPGHPDRLHVLVALPSETVYFRLFFRVYPICHPTLEFK